MTKLSRKPIEPKQMGYYINDLWSAFTLVDSKEDIRSLFKDLFSHTEYKMFAKRLQIARLLLKGENYEDIRRVLKVTDTTIAHVSNILANGGQGFRLAEDKLVDHARKSQQRKHTYYQNLENPFLRRLKKGK